jgi:hypothetical protein
VDPTAFCAGPKDSWTLTDVGDIVRAVQGFQPPSLVISQIDALLPIITAYRDELDATGQTKGSELMGAILDSLGSLRANMLSQETTPPSTATGGVLQRTALLIADTLSKEGMTASINICLLG